VRGAQSWRVATDDISVATRAHPLADHRRSLVAGWESSPFGIGFLNADGHVVESNEALRSITGYDADELARQPVSSYTHPDDDLESVANFRRLVAGETDSYRLETRLIRKDGTAVWIDGYITATEETPGAPRSALAMVKDITSRKLTELALRDQNARLSRVVETQAEIAGADLELDDVSQLIAERAQELTGADGATVSILDGDELVTRATIGSTAAANRFSVPLLHGGRNVGSLSVAKGAVTDEDRRTLELLAVVLSSAVSVAAEREARREQVEALARFETIFESAPIGIGILSLSGRLRNTNAVMRDISGRSAEELASRNVLEYTVPEDVPEVVRLFTAMLEGKHDSYRHEHRLIAKGGEVVWVDSATALLRDADGKPQGAVSMSQNITQRRAAEEELRQSQKIDAIGQLTAGIAHDFNNLLLGMLGYTELAQAEVGADGPAAAYLSCVEASARRAAALTDQLLAFGRRQALQPRPLELNALVSETVEMLRRVLGERIELVTVLDPALDPVRADPGQMQQVLLNLALNARDAMRAGGTLTIRTSNTEVCVGDPRCRELEPGSYVVLSVEDEGCGMTLDVVDRIFEPFFTTKGVGEGTGLGLSSSHGIIKQSGGHIEVSSRLGEGSSFHCYLPAIPGAALPENQDEPESPRVLSQTPQGAGRRILVVEDEDVVRTLLARTLERLGYEVETAPDPSVALPTLRDRGDEFALVISDMVMPHTSGAEFAREVATWKPELPFVFISGYTEDVAARSGTVATGSFLQKPFTSEALATAVHDALERST
jgi:two-component system cell cycle sensor histidine kinase/response regulator CckA